MSFLRGLLIIPPVVAGVAIVYYAVSSREAPVRELPAESATTARVLTLKPQTFVPRIEGFGSAEPSRTWSAIAQVAGRVDYVNPKFVRGEVMRKGETLVRIAADDYELSIAQSQANIENSEAQIEELRLSRETTRLSLEIERNAYDLKQKELARQKKLVASGTISLSTLDNQEAAVLTQKARVQDQENKLALIPAQMKALETSKAVAGSEMKIALLNLERTTIAAPFDGRIAEADAEISQFIAAGTKIGSLDGMDAAEIDVQLPPAQMGGFVRMAFLHSGADVPKFGEQFGLLKALVSIDFAEGGPVWQADVKRISDTVDPETRSIGIIVSVKDPYKFLKPGKKPPLIKGMFTKVQVRGPELENVILVPRNAIRDGQVKLVSEDSRLHYIPVEIDYVFRDIAAVRGALQAGAQIVVSDMTPAIEGMLIKPVEDLELRNRIDRLAKPSEGQLAGETD